MVVVLGRKLTKDFSSIGAGLFRCKYFFAHMRNCSKSIVPGMQSARIGPFVLFDRFLHRF
ncbi:hypothetical protein COLO4_01164 [Corchorus olitorius]|uniref:Uncharacterized protein n=1 Tax=Corchorus olitorius TaxID=93759 RepID=A0A1R3L2Z6_9ROSI|nr:hypothetical protein COLO4_01164 [Corchorus olitorius]